MYLYAIIYTVYTQHRNSGLKHLDTVDHIVGTFLCYRSIIITGALIVEDD